MSTIQHSIRRLGAAAGGGALASLAADFGNCVSTEPAGVGSQNHCALTNGPQVDGSAGAGTAANRPLGIVESASPDAGGEVTIIDFGVAEGIAGGAGIAAATTLLTSDATGNLIAFVLPVAGTNGWTIGRLMADDPTRVIAAGEKFRMFVDVKLIQG